MIGLADFPTYLRAHIGGNQRDFARRSGFSEAYVSLVLNGKKPPSAKMLAAVGLRREIKLVALKAGEA